MLLGQGKFIPDKTKCIIRLGNAGVRIDVVYGSKMLRNV